MLLLRCTAEPPATPTLLTLRQTISFPRPTCAPLLPKPPPLAPPSPLPTPLLPLLHLHSSNKGSSHRARGCLEKAAAKELAGFQEQVVVGGMRAEGPLLEKRRRKSAPIASTTNNNGNSSSNSHNNNKSNTAKVETNSGLATIPTRNRGSKPETRAGGKASNKAGKKVSSNIRAG